MEDSRRMDGSKWTVAEGTRGDMPLIVRFREIDEETQFVQFPHLVRISWTYTVANEYGLPDKQSDDRLYAFESVLITTFEASSAVLTAVMTNGGTRDFYLYVADLDAFIESFSGLGEGDQPYPVYLEVARDEGGDFYLDLLNSCA